MTNGPNKPHEITDFLERWRQGDEGAFEHVIDHVYKDLRRRAAAYLKNERREHTLQPTALVHEAFLKLVDKREIRWQDRNHFIAVAAQAMRRILVDHARSRKRDKRGGENEDLPLDDATRASSDGQPIDLVALDEALKNLETFDERQARIVELKYFGGMTLDEAADLLGVSRATVRRDWQVAKAWLRRQLM
jgi:RNA polymerase sigma factor (TIGR02999 family)